MTGVQADVIADIAAGVAVVSAILAAGVGVKGAFFVWRLISKAWNKSV